VNVTIDNRPTNKKCRWCTRKARWSIMRDGRYSWENLCHFHLGIVLRNLGLSKLRITKTASAEAEVDA
jgi:hypothetical protein